MLQDQLVRQTYINCLLNKMMNDILQINVFGNRWSRSTALEDGIYPSQMWMASEDPLSGIQVLADITTEKELITFLHDIYHESARRGHDQVNRIDK